MKKYKVRSLVLELGVIIAVAISVTIMLCTTIVVYSSNVVNTAAVGGMQSGLESGAEQIENDLQGASHLLQETITDYIGYAGDYHSPDLLAQYAASVRMAGLMDAKMESNPAVDCVFFTAEDSRTLLLRYQKDTAWQVKFALQDYVLDAQAFDNDAVTGGWHVVTAGEHTYLLQFFRLTYGGMGVLVDAERLMQSLNGLAQGGKTQYLLMDGQGAVLSTRGAALTEDTSVSLEQPVRKDAGRNLLYVVRTLSPYPIALAGVLHYYAFWYDMELVPLLFLLLGAVSVSIIAVSGLYMRHEILRPIRQLIDATQIIEKGNLDYRLSEQNGAAEFRALMTSFNYMTAEVKHQKIVAYEQEISRQKTELKYLQMQLRPHFYLNALTTISSLSIQRRDDDVQAFVRALSEYLRYLIDDPLAMSTVRAEIHHAAAFIELQRIKSPDLVFCMENVEDRAADVPMPKLLVHTFIENIFKHAFDGESMLSIFIRARYEAGMTRIVIEDSGTGFSPADLAGNFSAGHVGVTNVRQTLRLLYGRDDLLKLSNNEQGGARVEIDIPDVREGKAV